MGGRDYLNVSILIVLDVILEANAKTRLVKLLKVSILIVLDVILEVVRITLPMDSPVRFNPYCVGCNLRRGAGDIPGGWTFGFNPYCVGCNLRRAFSLFNCFPVNGFQSLLCWM